MSSFVRDRFIKDDGLSIPYISNVHEGQSAVILCLHGFAGDKDSSVIAALMSSLDRHGIGSFTFDWPAHGESDAPDESLTVENCLADLDLCISKLKEMADVPISCFATSFGGYLATLYRNAHPDVFKNLILRSPALKMSKVFRGILGEEELAHVISGGKTVVGFERKMSLGMEFYGSLCRNDAFSDNPPRPKDMLIIQGDRDDIVDPKDTIAYAARDGIEIRIFEGTDHIYKRPGEKERIIETAEYFLLSAKAYDEIWALESAPVLEYFKDQPDVTVIPMPARKLGTIELPQTRVIFRGDDADPAYQRFFLHFLKAGG